MSDWIALGDWNFMPTPNDEDGEDYDICSADETDILGDYDSPQEAYEILRNDPTLDLWPVSDLEQVSDWQYKFFDRDGIAIAIVRSDHLSISGYDRYDYV